MPLSTPAPSLLASYSGRVACASPPAGLPETPAGVALITHTAIAKSLPAAPFRPYPMLAGRSLPV